MSKNAILGIVVVIIVLLAGVFFVTQKASAPSPSAANPNAGYDAAAGLPPTTGTGVNASTSAAALAPVTNASTVTYTDTGFSPKTLTVKVGTAVRFVNNSSGKMWVASNPHPIHNGYDGTTLAQHCAAGSARSFDACVAIAPGAAYIFTFNKAGSWGYHNHMNVTDLGTVVVTK